MAAAFGKGSAVSLVFQPQAGGVECGIVLITHAPNSLAVPGAWCSVHGWIANHGAGALEIMMRDWGNMAERGTQTCWETFEYNDKNWTRSVAHAWSAAPAVYLPEEILGIHPLEPGFKEFRVAPVAGDLKGRVVP